MSQFKEKESDANKVDDNNNQVKGQQERLQVIDFKESYYQNEVANVEHNGDTANKLYIVFTY